MSKHKQILMVVTNQSQVTEDHKTGVWLEEFAIPYNMFKEREYEVEVKSIEGGSVPLDPNSVPDEIAPEWEEAEKRLEHTQKLRDEDTGYDAVFMPGGHGTMFDFPDSEALQNVLQKHAEDGKLVAAVCHGPAGFVNAKQKNGTPLVKGKNITGFTNAEEEEMGLHPEMPFMLESGLEEAGADFVHSTKWSDFSVKDGQFITGQNPQSSASTAEKVVNALEGRQAPMI